MGRLVHPPLRPYSFNGWLYIPIARNAHRSIVNAIQASGQPYTKEYWNALPNLPRVVLMREPVSRAFSSYCMFVDDGTIDTDFSTFLLNADYTDMHMLPQWDCMGKELPTRLVKDLDTLKSILGLNTLESIGESKQHGLPVLTPEAKAKVDSIYSEDKKLWYGIR